MAFLRSLPGIDIMPPTKIQQISLPELTINYNFKEVPRYDRCATCHQGIDRIGYDKDAHGERDGRGLPFAPVPDHGRHHGRSAGRWSRPDFISTPTALTRSTALAARSVTEARARAPISLMPRIRPTRVKQAEEWHKEHDWHEIHHWDFPMLPKRFIESSCLKCHTQVTDIPQAKKLQAGYQRIVKYGCTGCHTIGGEGAIRSRPDRRATGWAQPHPHRLQGLEGLGAQVDHESSRVPARFADAPVLRVDQQSTTRKTGPRTTPRSTRSLITCSPRARPSPNSSIRRRRPTRPRAKSCSSRRAAWPVISTGPTRPPTCSSWIASRPTRLTRSTRPRPTIPRDSPRRSRSTPRPISARTCRTWPPSSSPSPPGSNGCPTGSAPRRSIIPRA